MIRIGMGMPRSHKSPYFIGSLLKLNESIYISLKSMKIRFGNYSRLISFRVREGGDLLS